MVERKWVADQLRAGLSDEALTVTERDEGSAKRNELKTSFALKAETERRTVWKGWTGCLGSRQG